MKAYPHNAGEVYALALWLGMAASMTDEFTVAALMVLSIEA